MSNKENELVFRYKYWRPAVTADNVVFRFDGKNLLVLLIKRKNEPFKDKWAFPGGFMEQNENLQQTALRELREETGIVPDFTCDLCFQSEPDRDPREQVVSAVFYSFVRDGNITSGDDAADAQWFNINELPELAFDHQQIMEKAIFTLRVKIRLDPNFFWLLDDEFTLPDLCRLWTCVLNKKFDRRNFQKHWINFSLITGIITPVEDLNSTRKRSAKISRKFKYNEEAYHQFCKKKIFQPLLS